MPFIRVTLNSLIKKDYDFAPETLGEHIRKRRLVLGQNQREAAGQLGVTPPTLLNWEKGYTVPTIEDMRGVIQFLEYYPFKEPESLGERMLAKRRYMGWTITKAAEALGVDPSTWGEWERTGIVLWPRYQKLLDSFLHSLEH